MRLHCAVHARVEWLSRVGVVACPLPSKPLFHVATNIVNAVVTSCSRRSMRRLWVRRWRGSHGISRRLALPVAVAAITAAAVTVAEAACVSLGASDATVHFILTTEAYVQIAVPAAFLISVMRRRFARTAIVELLLRLRGTGRAASVTDALRSVFEDPGLEIQDWAPGTELLPAEAGMPAPAAANGRAVCGCPSRPAPASSSPSCWLTRRCRRTTTWSGRPSPPARLPCQRPAAGRPPCPAAGTARFPLRIIEAGVNPSAAGWSGTCTTARSSGCWA